MIPETGIERENNEKSSMGFYGGNRERKIGNWKLNKWKND